jgi:hypothetical protein
MSAPALDGHEASSVEVPLLPQQRYFFRWYQVQTNLCTRTFGTTVDRECTAAHVLVAIDQLMARFEALRATFVNTGSGWRQLIRGHRPFQRLEIADLRSVGGADQDRIYGSIAHELGYSIQPSDDWLLRVVLCVSGADSVAVLFGVHSLLVDHLSIEILLSEFHRGLTSALHRRPSSAPAAAGGTYSAYCWALQSASRSTAHAGLRPISPLKAKEVAAGRNTRLSSAELSFEAMAEEQTTKLFAILRSGRVSVPLFLTAVLIVSTIRWAQVTALRVRLVSHGRLLNTDAGRLEVVGEVGRFASLIYADIVSDCRATTIQQVQGVLDAIKAAYEEWHLRTEDSLILTERSSDRAQVASLGINYIDARHVSSQQLADYPVLNLSPPMERWFPGALREVILSGELKRSDTIRLTLRWSKNLHDAREMETLRRTFEELLADSLRSIQTSSGFDQIP